MAPLSGDKGRKIFCKLEYNVRVLEHSVKRICYTFAAVYLETVLIFYKQLILLLVLSML